MFRLLVAVRGQLSVGGVLDGVSPGGGRRVEDGNSGDFVGDAVLISGGVNSLGTCAVDEREVIVA